MIPRRIRPSFSSTRRRPQASIGGRSGRCGGGEWRWELPVALAGLDGEPPDRWLLFETNQGTDDHLTRHSIALRPSTSVSITGRVGAPPRTVRGGHVVFPLLGRHPIDIVAYEPSKGFRARGRDLAPRDGLREGNEGVGTTRAVSVPALRDASPSVRRPSHHSTSEDFPRLVRTARGVPSSSEQAAETDGLRPRRKGSGGRQAA